MKHLFIFIFILFSLGLNAQQHLNYSNADLSTVLKDLESSYDIRFSYNSKIFKAKKIDLNLKAASLEVVLSELEKNLKATFEKVDERYYILKFKTDVTVCGYLIDSYDETPIVGANILIKGRKKGTTTNKSGFFKLEQNHPSDTLSVSFLGYKTLHIPVAETEESCGSYQLVQENFLLNEVVVQEYLTAGITRLKEGAIQIRPNTSAILSGMAEPDVLQSIQVLPGIESPSETASGLHIRGGSPDQNLVLWDGIKMYNSDHFFGMISTFNPYITDNIKVYRNGAKAKYGDRVSGVVDITTSNKIPEKTEGGLGLNLLHADAFLKIPMSKKVGMLFSVRRSFTDIIKTPTFNNFSSKVFQNTAIVDNQDFFEPEFSDIKEDFFFTDVNLKLIANLSSKQVLTWSNLFTRNKLDYEFEDIDFDIFSKDKLAVKNLGGNIKLRSLWSDAFNTEVKLYYSEYDLQYSQSSDEGDGVEKENNISEFGAFVHTQWKLNDNLSLSNGYQFFSNQVSYLLQDSGFVESSNENSPTHSVYSQLNYSKENSWYFDLGIRASNYIASQRLFFEPRLYAEYAATDHLRLKVSAEIKNQAVSQIIEFATIDFGLENQVWALSSEEGLPILQSNQLSAGFLFSKSGWNIDVEAYYKDIKGLTSLTKGFESTASNFSEGNSLTKGIDILAKKKIGNYSTWIGYTHSSTNFTFDDLNQGRSFRGNNDIAHSLSWSHFYQWKKLQFSLGWKYRTGIPYTQALGTSVEDGVEFIDFDAINGETLPDYHRMDFSLVYDFKLSKGQSAIDAKLGLSLLNVYGRQNLLNRNSDLFLVTDDNGQENIELREISRFSLGTTPNFVFRLNF
jgi:hypothetical protein